MRRRSIEAAVRNLAPAVPPHEFAAIVDHALGSPGLKKAAPETAAWLSLVAYARHVFTDYEALLTEGYDRDSARFFVADAIDATLSGWGVRRSIAGDPAAERYSD